MRLKSRWLGRAVHTGPSALRSAGRVSTTSPRRVLRQAHVSTFPSWFSREGTEGGGEVQWPLEVSSEWQSRLLALGRPSPVLPTPPLTAEPPLRPTRGPGAGAAGGLGQENGRGGEACGALGLALPVLSPHPRAHYLPDVQTHGLAVLAQAARGAPGGMVVPHWGSACQAHPGSLQDGHVQLAGFRDPQPELGVTGKAAVVPAAACRLPLDPGPGQLLSVA